MGRIRKHLPLVAAALVFGQEVERVLMATRHAARRRASAPARPPAHRCTYQESFVAAHWAAVANGNWAALDGRVSGLTGRQLNLHWHNTLLKHVQGTSSSELTPSRAEDAVLAKYGLSRGDVGVAQAIAEAKALVDEAFEASGGVKFASAEAAAVEARFALRKAAEACLPGIARVDDRVAIALKDRRFYVDESPSEAALVLRLVDDVCYLPSAARTKKLSDAVARLQHLDDEATARRDNVYGAIEALLGAQTFDAVADAKVTLVDAYTCERRALCRAHEQAVRVERLLPASLGPRRSVYVRRATKPLVTLPDADWPGWSLCWCQVAGLAGVLSHLSLYRDDAGTVCVNYAESDLEAVVAFWKQADFSSTPHGGGFLAEVDANYLLEVVAHQDRVGRDDGAEPGYCDIGSAALAALGGAEVGTYASDAAGSSGGTDVCVGACEPGARVTVYVSDVQKGRATVLAVAGAVPGIPRGAVFSLTTRALDALGNPLSRAARDKMTPRELADATLELVLGCYVFPFPYYLGDGGANGEAAPAKMMREGARVAACIDALSEGGDWFDDPILLTCAAPNFSDGCLHFALWVALWAAAPLLGVTAPMTHSHQLGRAGIECGFAAATAVFQFLYPSVPGESSYCGRSLPAELVNDTVPVRVLTPADRALVAEFFETGPTANCEGLEVFHDLRDSTAFAPLVAELKGMLERRAAPFSQNIRKAFEVLVGAARVEDSVHRSEVRIAANETKREDEMSKQASESASKKRKAPGSAVEALRAELKALKAENKKLKREKQK